MRCGLPEIWLRKNEVALLDVAKKVSTMPSLANKFSADRNGSRLQNHSVDWGHHLSMDFFHHWLVDPMFVFRVCAGPTYERSSVAGQLKKDVVVESPRNGRN